MPKGSEPISYEEIKRRFFNKGLYLITTKVLSSKQKLVCTDKEGYLYSTNYNNLGNLKPNHLRRFNKFNPYTIANIEKYLKEVSPDTKILSKKFLGSKEKLKFLCPECGQEYERTWDETYVKHRFLCQECTKKLSGNHLKYTIEFAKDILSQNNLTLLEENYMGNNSNMLCEDKDGYRYYVKLSNFTCDNYKKPHIFSTFFNGDNFIYNINRYFFLNDINCRALYYVINNSKYNGEPCVFCQCECGEIFCTNINAIKNGQVRCTKCTSYYSIIETKVKDWLDKKNILYERQKKFADCKDERELPFDYYLPKYNMCIEVDGRQHDYPQKFHNCSDIEMEQEFIKRKKHDEIKTEYCKHNGIELLRIKEQDIKRNEKYKELLYNKLIKK